MRPGTLLINGRQKQPAHVTPHIEARECLSFLNNCLRYLSTWNHAAFLGSPSHVQKYFSFFGESNSAILPSIYSSVFHPTLAQVIVTTRSYCKSLEIEKSFAAFFLSCGTTMVVQMSPYRKVHLVASNPFLGALSCVKETSAL